MFKSIFPKSATHLPCALTFNPDFQRALRPALLAIAVAAANYQPSIAIADTATTQESARDFDIAAGPLSEVISRFAGAAGVALSFDADRLAGIQSSGLKGRYSVEQGFARLLLESGFVVANAGPGRYTLQSAPTIPGEVHLKQVRVQEAIERSNSTEGTGSYSSGELSLGKGQRWLETPQTVAVMTQQRIQDQALVSVADVIAQTPGITAATGRGNEPEAFYSRGFAITSVQIDGVATGGSYDGTFLNPNLAMYEHIEVIRGADGLNAGTGEPGGSINLVRKRPLLENQLKVSASAGRWNNYMAQADVTGPIALDGGVRGRLAASYLDREFFYDVAEDQNKFVYGIVDVDLTPATVLSVGGSYERRDRKAYYGGLRRYTDGSSTRLSRSTALMPDWNDGDFKTRELFARVEHRFNDDWKIEASYTDIDREGWELLGTVSGSIDPQTGAGAGASAYDYGYRSRIKAFDIHTNGAFMLLGGHHELLLGADHQDRQDAQYYNGVIFAEALPAIDIFNFDPSAFPKPVGTYLGTAYDPYGEKRSSVYGKLLLQLAEPLKLALGARYSDYETYDVSASYAQDGSLNWGGESRYEDNGVLTPYAGLLYAINKSWMSYISLAQIDKPQANSRSAPAAGSPEGALGSPLDPIEGRNYELGIKGEIAGGALRTALALYRIEREGEAVRDPRYPPIEGEMGASCCYLAQGKIISEGVDTEIGGEILPGWQASAGYTYNDNRNARNDNAVYSSVTPRHILRFWNSYQLPGEFVKWKIGAGATVQSEACETGTVWSTGGTYRTRQGGYSVWNALVEYQVTSDWSLALNVSNLFDKVYNAGVGARDQADWYGEPRNFVVTLRGRL